MSLFICEKGAGFTSTKKLEKLGYKGIDSAELVFDNFRVPAANLVGGAEGQGFKHVMGGLELGRINVAARGVGVARACLEESVAYAQLRRTFGKVRSTTSLFYQDIEDAIFSFSGLNQYGTVVSSYKNVDKVRQYGLELILEATDVLVPGLDIDANVTRIDAKTIKNSANTAAEGVKFPRIPDWRSSGNIRYRVSDSVKASLGWRYASRPNSDLFGLSRGGAYGFQTEYFTVDSRVTWNATDKVQLGVGIDNLFNDQAYVSHPLPQRTFVVDLKTKW